MENTSAKLWNKNFVLLLSGMTFNLFANTLIRFTLPLYILMESGDPSLMALVMTLSAIPLIILSPVGGIFADRMNKKKILSTLDWVTALSILVFIFFRANVTPLVGVILFFFIFLTFEGLNTPAQEASVPALVPEKDIMTANGMTFLVTTITNVVAPILAGIMLERGQFVAILIISISCYLIASGINAYMDMPYKKEKLEMGVIAQASVDIKESFQFVCHENRTVGKLIVISFFFCLFVTPILFIGLPVLITGNLNMGEASVGVSTGIKTIGSVIGLAIVGVLGKKLSPKNSRTLLFLESLMFLPIILSLLFTLGSTINFVILTASFFIMQVPATIFAVILYSHVQKVTPDKLVGKVIAVLGSVLACGTAIGMQIFGELFARFTNESWIVLSIALVLSLIVTFFAKFEIEKN